MKFLNIISGIVLLFLTVTVYGSPDTVIIFISDSGTPSFIETMYNNASNWQNIEFDISGYNRDSIKSIRFHSYHHSKDTGGYYMKEIALYGSDTLIIEDFECYDTDSINGPMQQFVTSDRLWGVTWVYDGSEIYAVIIQGAFKYMHCYYFTRLNKVGSELYLSFSPSTKDWSQYNKICFTVRSDMPTGIVPQKKHYNLPKMTVCKLQRRGLYIALPVQCESADLFLYALSGRLLRKKSYKENGPFFWQLPFIPNGAYILTVDDGANTYSDIVVIER